MNSLGQAYFVDTSYLLELYRVPGASDPVAIVEIRKRFERAWTNRDLVFLLLGCLLEFGNHITDIKNANDRNKWAKYLHELVVEALDPNAKMRRFVLLAAPGLDETSLLVASWRKTHITAPRGLVDAALVEKARWFKQERAVGKSVHIWTRDRRLKGIEPDPEPFPFV